MRKINLKAELIRDNFQNFKSYNLPIALLKKLIKIFTDEGETVIDPVAGSGSTLIAALKLNRHAFGFEIDRMIYKKADDWLTFSGFVVVVAI